MKDPVIMVLIVNYRTSRLVIEGLRALQGEKANFPRLYAVVVDNASADDSVAHLNSAVQKNNWQDWVKVVPAEQNGGFSYGNNRAILTAQDWVDGIDYFWMLNPDVEVLPGATGHLVTHLDQFPLTIAGSRLQDRDGTKQVSAFNYPSIVSEMCAGLGFGFVDKLFAKYLVRRPISSQAESCDWLAGASLMFSAATLDKVGFMDEGYFLYFEEVDYLLSAHKKGIDCWYIPDSCVIHEVGAATGISDGRKQQPRRPRYWFESRRRYFLKNHSRCYLFFTDLLWSLGYAFWLIRKSIVKSADVKRQPPYLLSDFIKTSQLNPVNWFQSIGGK